MAYSAVFSAENGRRFIIATRTARANAAATKDLIAKSVGLFRRERISENSLNPKSTPLKIGLTTTLGKSSGLRLRRNFLTKKSDDLSAVKFVTFCFETKFISHLWLKLDKSDRLSFRATFFRRKLLSKAFSHRKTGSEIFQSLFPCPNFALS